MINLDDFKEELDIIEFFPYWITIMRDGIYLSLQSGKGKEREIFSGEFEFIGYDENEEIFIVMRNSKVYHGSFREIMRQFNPHRYSYSYNTFKKIFNYYSNLIENKEKER